MLLTAAALVRALSDLACQADAALAEHALRNAAVSIADRDARRLEDARTLRDLARLGFADDPAESSVN